MEGWAKQMELGENKSGTVGSDGNKGRSRERDVRAGRPMLGFSGEGGGVSKQSPKQGWIPLSGCRFCPHLVLAGISTQ